VPEKPVIDLSGQIAVVTGAGQGIGAAIARIFARAGADLVIVDIDQARARESAEMFAASGRKALAVQADVASASDVERIFSTVQANFGRLDILINNAGIWFRKPFMEITDTEWDRVLCVNLKGTFMCVQRAARIMIPNRSGSIINIASHAGIFYSRGQGAHYAASKAAIIQLTRVLAFELSPLGIRINAVAPGGIDTGISPLVHSTPANPLGRRGMPGDVAHAALFLASPMAAFITGQTLVVNGGAVGS
jgi:3-oxoacyl-[acyl-carrier protein] reductase